MNYRHIFHAGNFADVFKHAIMANILAYLMQKPQPLRYIDTHAGAGLYDLAAPHAQKTGEAKGGIVKLREAVLSPALRLFLEPYLTTLAEVKARASAPTQADDQGAETSPDYYPGSPLIAKHLLRADDKIMLCDVHEPTYKALCRATARDKRVKRFLQDGYKALPAFIPPPERRGLIVIDPPFESLQEWHDLAGCLIASAQKWSTGVLLAWHPIKERSVTTAFYANLRQHLTRPCLAVEMAIGTDEPDDTGKIFGLRACGVVIVNPPFTLYDELNKILPELAKILALPGPQPLRNHALYWLHPPL